MKELLISARQKVESHLEAGMLCEAALSPIEEIYHQITAAGLKNHASLPALPQSKLEKKTGNW